MPLSAQRNRQVVEKFHEAINAGDMDARVALIADDIEWTHRGTTSLSGTCRGMQDLGGRAYGNSDCWILRIRNGRIAGATGFLDTEPVASVFG